ncbi:MAG: hypothetical protein NXI10_08660 [bacterium]|nr:hypothetical protein [bacterium]
MEKEKKIGAWLGMAGGLLGIIAVLVIFGKNSLRPMHYPLILSIISVGLTFSALFGAKAAKEINQKKLHPVLAGIKSTVFTTLCSDVGVTILMALMHGEPSWILSIPVIMIMSFVAGGIPMLIIAIIFGYTLQFTLKKRLS